MNSSAQALTCGQGKCVLNDTPPLPVIRSYYKLAKQGVNLQSDEYYEAIDTRMRQVFPENFEEEIAKPEAEKPKRQANVVAPATRSIAPKKVKLTQTQVAIAKRLGVPIELYAQKVAEEMRKENG